MSRDRILSDLMELSDLLIESKEIMKSLPDIQNRMQELLVDIRISLTEIDQDGYGGISADSWGN